MGTIKAFGEEDGKLRLSEMVKNGEVEATDDARTQIANQDFEDLMLQGLSALGKTVEEIQRDAKSAQWKIALAAWIKERTSAKNRLISERLNMGHPATMSNHLTAYRRGPRKQYLHSRKLSQIL